MIYAGFWRRIGACLVDKVILDIILVVLLFILGISFLEDPNSYNPDLLNEVVKSGFRGKVISLGIAIAILYFTGFQSSRYQATPGMMLFGMKIITYGGQKISFGRALLRYFASWLSYALLFIGYLMIAFTSRKQGLHDYIAKTLVICKS